MTKSGITLKATQYRLLAVLIICLSAAASLVHSDVLRETALASQWLERIKEIKSEVGDDFVNVGTAPEANYLQWIADLRDMASAANSTIGEVQNRVTYEQQRHFGKSDPNTFDQRTSDLRVSDPRVSDSRASESGVPVDTDAGASKDEAQNPAATTQPDNDPDRFAALNAEKAMLATLTRALNEANALRDALQRERTKALRLTLLSQRGSPLRPAFWKRTWFHIKRLPSVIEADDPNKGIRYWLLPFIALLGAALLWLFSRPILRRVFHFHVDREQDATNISDIYREDLARKNSLERLSRATRRFRVLIIAGLVLILWSLLAPFSKVVPNLHDIATGLPALVIAVVMMLFAASRNRVRFCNISFGFKNDSEENQSKTALSPVSWMLSTRLAVMLLALAVPVAIAFGYANLAQFLTRFLLVIAFGTGILVILQWQLYHAIQKLISFDSNRSIDDEAVNGTLGRGLLYTLLEALLFIAVVVCCSLFLGASTNAILQTIKQLWSGFEIASFHFQLSNFVLAVCAFATVWLFAKLIIMYLRTRVFPQTTWDQGIRVAILTSLTYAAFVIAFFVAIRVLGFDLGRLALIVGALSVGLGLGLQGVVNNFFSGLTLLYERAIRPGDWIEVDGMHGTVKHVSVRYTEIETFARARVFVPNSKMIDASITSYTRGNLTGRVEMDVGVDYDCDPRLVLKALDKAARSIPNRTFTNDPIIQFVGFGDSAINFRVKVYIRDVNYTIGAETALGLAIYDALKEDGIDIPFNQLDVNLVRPEPPNPTNAMPISASEEGATTES